MITIGAAGHAIPMFELAKAMKNHNVTFITEQHTRTYINFDSYSNRSSFRIIYTNDSADASIDEKKTEKDIAEYFITHSIPDSVLYMIPAICKSTRALMTKSIHLLMLERYDVIIGTSLIIGTPALCKQAQTSCVTLMAENSLNMFDINLPNSNSLLSSKQLTEFKYRIYNFAFTLRLIIPLLTKVLKAYYALFQSLPQVAGSFYETFTLRNLLSAKSKCLELFSLPPTLYPPSHSHHYTKYLGGFIDESSIEYMDNDLTRWIQSKSTNSIVYVAFGSISIIEQDRTRNLIYGLVEFLLQTDTTSVLLAFRHKNYDNYQIVLNEMKNDEYRRILTDNQRVKVDNSFLQQKWVLQQKSVNLFISHCGMGSIVEGFYFEKPILCLPLCTDQFPNAIAIDHSGVGLSLFEPPSLLKSFLNPLEYHDYKFSADSVTTKLLTMWRNISYEKTARIMSLEMKHAGGVKRAVEEIELLVHLDGNLDRYATFQNTLPFYQRYMLDLAFVCIVLPLLIVFYLCVKCCKRNRKDKKD
jgi:hypothetical protein